MTPISASDPNARSEGLPDNTGPIRADRPAPSSTSAGASQTIFDPLRQRPDRPNGEAKAAGAAPVARSTRFDTSVLRRPVTSIAPAIRVDTTTCQRPPIFHVAIIGAGPRGLGVLERIQAMLSEEHLLHIGIDARINVHVIEPGEPGQGVHSPEQGEHLLLNTGAGAITMWDTPDHAHAAGPSLKDWANAQGYRFVDGQFVRDPCAGREIHDDDYLPRAILGRYLEDVYRTLEKHLDEDPRLRLIHHKLRAVDVKQREDDRLKVVLEAGFPLIVDYAVLTAGAPTPSPTTEESELLAQVARCQSRNALLKFVPHPYPLDALHDIPRDAVVAVRGMGLTGLDVIAELTAGRGGRFVPSEGGALRYVPSGNEPRITLFSRSGFALNTRAVNQKDPHEPFEPQFLTRAVIDELRSAAKTRTGSMQLDFEADLLPLIEKEMTYAYHLGTELEPVDDPASYRPTAHETNVARSLLAPSEEATYPDHASYARAVSERLRENLSSAKVGNVDEPTNAAAHVLHEIRDILRYAVDFGGLTPDSHRHFLELAARMNRASGAVPDRRNEELLALIEAGVVSLGPGPGSDVGLDEEAARFMLRSSTLGVPHEIQADVLIHAQLDGFPAQPQADSLYANLLESGLIRPYRNGDFAPGGIDINHDHHVIDRSGKPNVRLDAAGTATEGPNLLTSILPGPGSSIRPLVDSTQIAANIARRLRLYRRPLKELIEALPEGDRPQAVWHPAKSEDGAVRIHMPTQPSPRSLWSGPATRLLFAPGGPAPDELNGIAMQSAAPPADAQAWLTDSAEDIAVDIPYPLDFASNRRRVSGVVIIEDEPEPRLWLAVPTNHYEARVTLPQGGADPDEPLPVTGRRETFEELGLLVRLRWVVGDFGQEYDPTRPELRAGPSNNVRYYMGRRIGGTVRDMGWETQTAILTTFDDALSLLERPRDRAIVRAARQQWHDFKRRSDSETSLSRRQPPG